MSSIKGENHNGSVDESSGNGVAGTSTNSMNASESSQNQQQQIDHSADHSPESKPHQIHNQSETIGPQHDKSITTAASPSPLAPSPLAPPHISISPTMPQKSKEKAARFHQLYNHPKHTPESLRTILGNSVDSSGDARGEHHPIAAPSPLYTIHLNRILANSDHSILCRDYACQTDLSIAQHDSHSEHADNDNISKEELLDRNQFLTNQLRSVEDYYVSMAKKEENTVSRYKQKLEEMRWIQHEQTKRLKEFLKNDWMHSVEKHSGTAPLSSSDHEKKFEKKWNQLQKNLSSVSYSNKPPSQTNTASSSQKSRKDYLSDVKHRKSKSKRVARYRSPLLNSNGILSDSHTDYLIHQELRTIQLRGYRSAYKIDESVLQHRATQHNPTHRKKRKKTSFRELKSTTNISVGTDSTQWHRYQIRTFLPKVIRKLDAMRRRQKRQLDNDEGVRLSRSEEEKAAQYRISRLIQYFADNETKILQELSEDGELINSSDQMDFDMLPELYRTQLIDLKAELKQKKKNLKDMHQLVARLQAVSYQNRGSFHQLSFGGTSTNNLNDRNGESNPSEGSHGVVLPKISLVGGEDNFDINKSRNSLFGQESSSLPPSPLRGSVSPPNVSKRNRSFGSPTVQEEQEKKRKLRLLSYSFDGVRTHGTQDLTMIPYDAFQKKKLYWEKSKGFTVRQ